MLPSRTSDELKLAAHPVGIGEVAPQLSRAAIGLRTHVMQEC